MRLIRILAVIGVAGLLGVGLAPAAWADAPVRQAVTYYVSNPCNGDTILAEGTLAQHFTERPDGGFTYHFRVDVAGVGEPSGDRYEFDQNWHSQSVTDPSRFSLHERYVVKNKSGGPSFTSDFRLRYADGELVTSVNDQRCK